MKVLVWIALWRILSASDDHAQTPKEALCFASLAGAAVAPSATVPGGLSLLLFARANIEKRQQFNPVLTLTQAVSNVETYPKMRNVNSLHAVQHSKGMRLRDP
ncbi:hypothetical protein AV530_019267 [Patagioenas fasciata monilis]|uniref:Secreted protein n=1 Tax=Patagioenas fasciata monilis TaxID=372326 RepID=A0A1V4JCV9_PATFA|nr:hypothetical protein AV530_019267 [Patagioenas fasciata monilis]